MNIFAEICKVNDEERMVYGYASTEALDVQGERVTKDAIAAALPDYMRFANVREMHQPSAVGVTKSAELDDNGLYIGAKVIDDVAWSKVKGGVYKGFSIGGKSTTKVDGVISGLRLTEISLVDRPANPECVIDLWKGEDMKTTTTTTPPAVDQLAEMLNKGEITPERLLELAKSASAPAAADPTDTVIPNGDGVAKAGDTEAAAAATETAEIVATEQSDAVTSETATETVAVTAEKAEMTQDIFKYAGEEVYDANTALQALAAVFSLFRSESGEEGEPPEQVAALKTVIDNLKAFISSEIMEDNGTPEGGAVHMSEQIEDVAKAAAAAEPAAEPAAETVAKAESVDVAALIESVTASATEKIAKAVGVPDGSTIGDFISKLATDRDTAVAKADEVAGKLDALQKRFDAMPAPRPATLRVVGKGADIGLVAKADVSTQEPQVIKKSDGTVDHEATAVEMVKFIHSQGGSSLGR